ncbi:MAG TPA: glycosyltransferase, partial [Chloroflexota bacterium]
MRIALVSPYDYATPGGVTEHVRHLALEFQQAGHETHVIAPCSEPELDAPVPFHKVSTPFGLPMNGSVARIGLNP